MSDDDTSSITRVELRLSDAVQAQRIGGWVAARADMRLAQAAEAIDVAVTDGSPPADMASVVLVRDGSAANALKAGAAFALPPHVDKAALLAAIKAAHAGLTGQARSQRRAEASGLDDDETGAGDGILTGREIEVLRLLADGASNKVIARRLAISVHTAKFHVGSIMSKLGATSRTDAVTRGMRLGLVLL